MAAGPIAAFVAAILAATGAVVLWTERLRGKTGPGSATNWVGETGAGVQSWSAGVTDWFFGGPPPEDSANPIAQMRRGEAKTGRLQAGARGRMADAERARAFQAQETSDLQLQLSHGMVDPAAAIKTARAQGNLPSEIAATQALKAADLERLRIAQDRKRESLTGAREELSLLKSSLEAEKQRTTAMQERYIGAKERFGGLEQAEQQKLLRIGEKARSGETLSREEAASMRGMGLESTAAVARKWDVGRAEAAGFERTFGAEDRRALQEGQARVAQFNVDARMKHELVVKLDADTRSISDLIATEVKKASQEMGELILRKVQQDRERAQAAAFHGLAIPAG